MRERVLREIYLPPFQAAVQQAKAWTVMAAYNAVNGIPATENAYLLTDILRLAFIRRDHPRLATQHLLQGQVGSIAPIGEGDHEAGIVLNLRQQGIEGDAFPVRVYETVCVYLHTYDYVCKRPTWTDAGERPKRKLTMWETPAGRGSLGWCHSTRTSTRQRLGGG